LNFFLLLFLAELGGETSLSTGYARGYNIFVILFEFLHEIGPYNLINSISG